MEKTYRETIVWQKAHLLALVVYRITRSFPSNERDVIIRQLRQSVSLISRNIIEAFQESSRFPKREFLLKAESALEQTFYLLMLSRDLDYLSRNYFETLRELCVEIKQMLKQFNQIPAVSLPETEVKR